jgi:hypothetical protein
MGVEDLAGFATEASAVASNIIENGQEFLSDGFNQLQEQVSTFAGDSAWFDSNFIGDIIPTDFTTLTNNFNFDSLTSNFTSTFPSLSSILPSPTSIANNLVNQVQNTAISLATNTVRQAVASVVPPALQPYTNQAINATTRSLSGAFAVSSTTPGTPGFVGPPAPSTAYSRVDPTTLEGFGVQATVDPTTLEGYGVNETGATPIPTTTAFPTPTNAGPSFQQFDDGSSLQTFEDGSTLAIDADGKPTSSPAPTDNAETRTVSESGVVTQTFEDGSTLTTFPDGRITSTPAPTDDPQSPTRSLAQAANSIVRSFTPGTVNDPSLATPPLSTASALAAAAALIPGGTAVTTAIADAAARAQGLLRQAQNQQTARVQSNNNAATGDWRVRLQLANASDYLYNAPDCGPLLWPLRDTDGVIFPYTPSIDTAYKANYTQYDLTHSNYRGYFYQNSYVDTINIKATFTAQDTVEANYLLAVIHFFRSVTKMFYGQDAQRGSPPPMVFLSGLGDFQFNRHPCLVSQFNYNLPADVNYIRAQSTLSNGGNQLAARTRQTTLGNPIASTVQRLASLGQKIFPGAVTAPFAPQGSLAAGNPTYVPTKMDINLSLLPVQTRSQVSQQFSVRGFANGNLLKGGFW